MRISDWSSDVCSSDLALADQAFVALACLGTCLALLARRTQESVGAAVQGSGALLGGAQGETRIHLRLTRSEEHTSELQSLMRNSYAVFCLKKKQIKNQI